MSTAVHPNGCPNGCPNSRADALARDHEPSHQGTRGTTAATAIAIVATAMSGGFGAYDPHDPAAFIGAMLGKAAGIFALSQIVFHSAKPAVENLGGTEPTSVSARLRVP